MASRSAVGCGKVIGVWGELWLGGVQVARGYLRRPELTADRFVASPWSMTTAGASVSDRRGVAYRTGDRVRWYADGELEFGGRIDFQVKLRGQRLELGEIEHALRAQPGVVDAVVLLDAMRSQWEHMGKKARASQCVMAVGVALNTLLWIHRPSWEGLLFVYGIGAQFVRSSRHCAVYASIVGFSVATDVLNILDTDVSASAFAATVQGLLLPVKIASIALVASLREALL